MGLPNSPEARMFYRAAKQRSDDSVYLLQGVRYTGAVYLAGYVVECLLKALIFESLPKKRRAEMLTSFRGGKAHDYEWLKEQYRASGGPAFPPAVARSFQRVNTWTTKLRYQPGTAKATETREFLAAVGNIFRWADERLGP
jgi:HEPN domain-containing protein